MPRMDWVMLTLGPSPALQCELCKETQEIPVSIRASVFKSMITAFTVAHRGCPRGEGPPKKEEGRAV